MVAGNETTRTAISHALCLLTEHPDQRELLLADLEGRIGPAVEEIVRYVSPVIWMRRTLTRDTVMNGHAYREGDKAVLFYQAANRDETVFAAPDRSTSPAPPTRTSGFGSAGPHFCLGAHLARREITAMLRELLTRVPDIRARASRTTCCPASSTASSTCPASSADQPPGPPVATARFSRTRPPGPARSMPGPAAS